MKTLQTVDFVVSAPDDRSDSSDSFLEVAEVGVLNEHGHLLGTFRDAGSLVDFLLSISGELKLVAMETIGDVRRDLIGRFYCDEPAAVHGHRRPSPTR